MKHVFLPIPDDQYQAIHERAQKQGQRDNEYILRLIKTNLDTNQSFAQKNGVDKAVKGEDIINNGNLVRLGGIYYNYRLQGQNTDGRVSDIERDTTYQVVGLDGNRAVLNPQK